MVTAAIVAATILVGTVVGGGWWLRDKVQSAIAKRIDTELPGAVATVHIHSFPFLIRLAASGTILAVSARLDHVSAGPVVFGDVTLPTIDFDRIDISVDDLRLRRSDLRHRLAKVEHVGRVIVTAIVSQHALDKDLGIPLTLGAGQVGIGGLSLHAQVTFRKRRISLHLAGERMLSFEAPPADILPCEGGAVVVPGAVRLSCVLHHLPPALKVRAYSF